MIDLLWQFLLRFSMLELFLLQEQRLHHLFPFVLLLEAHVGIVEVVIFCIKLVATFVRFRLLPRAGVALDGVLPAPIISRQASFSQIVLTLQVESVPRVSCLTIDHRVFVFLLQVFLFLFDD